MKSGVMFVAATLALSSGIGTGVSAGPTRIAVAYGELDLSKEAGRQALVSRIRTAAGQICGPKSHMLAHARNAAIEACVDEATDRALASLPAALAARFNGRVVREAGLQ